VSDSSIRGRVLELDDPRWLELVRAAPQSLPFHQPAWARLLAECYGYRPFVVALENGAGLAAGIPVLEVPTLVGGKRWVALPFTDHCAPLAEHDVNGSLVRALDNARRAAAVSKLEVRAPLDGTDVFGDVAGVLHVLDVDPDPDAAFDNFKAPVRRHVRKAERSGVTVRRGTTAADLTEVFYRLHVQTRRRQGVPVQPRRFFRLLWERVLEPGGGFVLVASAGGEDVAAAVFLAGNGTVIYKYGASDERAWPLRPNHVLFSHAIRWASENGYRAFDFGRTELAQDGLRAFKAGWGARELPLQYAVLADEDPGRSSGRLDAVVQRVIRSSPQWVCRGVGELLYRYAA
jgi:CelD/BcsL family acetyltransferase involved in cellulose biosynthesis